MTARAVSAVVMAAALGCASCSAVVEGSALRPSGPAVDAHPGFAFADDQCGLLADTSVQRALEADQIARTYSGAVCQYVLSRQQAPLDVVFAYFRSGDLQRERALAERDGADVSDTVIARHDGFLARRSAIGDQCTATATADPGVISWTVQVREQGRRGPDPCTDAQNLVSMTLSAEM